MLAVPGVDARLQLVAAGEQLAVAGREVVDDRVDTLPEGLRLDPRTGQGLLLDEPVQAGCDAEPADLNALVHVHPLPSFPYRGTAAGVRLSTFPLLCTRVKSR